MKELLIKIPQQWGIKDTNYEEIVRIARFDWDPSILTSLIKEGETSRDYIYRYTQEVGQEIKHESIRAGLSYLERAKQKLIEKVSTELMELEQELNEIERKIKAWHQLLSLNEEIIAEKERLMSELPEVDESLATIIGEMAMNGDHSWTDESPTFNVAQLSHTRLGIEEDSFLREEGFKYEASQRKMVKEAQKLRTASDIISTIPGLHRISQLMNERAERMENRQFTVALFGAFSAGKSSLANALLGFPVLPVSPHPTTAVINRIVPPTAEHPHGHVRVTIKSVETMTKDVTDAFRTIGISVESLEEALAQVTDVGDAAQHTAMKPHVSFLLAFKKGYEIFKDLLGTIVETDVENFSDFVANEEQACFVELVDVYYDCPLTRTGMTLVDTPGADSINARHTGVAFDYIKNADAILFVTYYNHAFSNADRQFLNQLGRVKDTFEMDKMFFLVNAADLAQSDQELTDVVNHVAENLLHHGIRNPRIFPVSSQTALWAKMLPFGLLGHEGERQYRLRTTGDLALPLMPTQEALIQSRMKSFEEAFYAFTVAELAHMAITAAQAEMGRALNRIDEWIRTQQSDIHDRMRKRAELEQAHLQALEWISHASTKPQSLAIEQEIEELTYYIKQRVGFKFNEMFNASFNGSDLIEDGRNMKKALRYCLRDLLGQLLLEIVQELRATALRIENYTRKSVKDVGKHWAKEIQQMFPANEWQVESTIVVDVPNFSDDLKNMDLESFHTVLAIFKNSKQFFEGNGKSQMKEALETNLSSSIE
ncbi:MAG: dynamin family protein, partial [Bacilli bacterium]